LLAVSAVASAQDRSPDPASVGQAAWTAVQERRFGDALEAFTQAAKARPRDPTLHLGAGVAAFMLGQDVSARASLERALAIAPNFADASRLLGEIHYRNGRLLDAIAVYEAALTHTPHPDIEQKLRQWQSDARVRAGSYATPGAHFTVRFQGPADDMLARRAVDMLEAAYWRIGGALGAYPGDPIAVFLYTEEQFRDVTRSPAWAAATYDGTIRVPVRGALASADDLERLLAHEFVHALIAGVAGRNVPQWLNEGLAVHFESVSADEGGDDRTVRVPLARLEGDFGELSPAEARSAYLRSTAAVRRMLRLRGPSAVIALLQDLGRGAPFASAFVQRMAMRYEDFAMLVDRE
jgi:tetratricopeptide (TPR) repeat protein